MLYFSVLLVVAFVVLVNSSHQKQKKIGESNYGGCIGIKNIKQVKQRDGVSLRNVIRL